ncbi:related to N-carbamoyl-L-amino acid hydrolase [Pseudozyma flocculosa]|uniref:Related to N-carbamoyl-L-amino acid hydrolase n=1 Tax=Pseudozyma flocculosa TaxID=84751 RepID=A0A5C3F463_9BASI|nr:related to N-carbamoyl-L-amino acid hydrolase [Pseudozyma flocculosa]
MTSRLPTSLHRTLSRYKPGDLRISPSRLLDTLHHSCQWGAAHRYGPQPTQTGMARLSLDANDAKVRAWMAREAEAVGCRTVVDGVGNQFFIRPGDRADAAPTAMGSHMDTQPTGGRYDGILGVVAGLEVMRTLHHRGLRTRYPLALVNWTNEEGARFPRSLAGSAVWAETLPLDQAWSLKDVNDPSITLRDALVEARMLGTHCDHRSLPLAAHFELHIEQGPILEQRDKRIGVVLGGQAYKWFDVEISGMECHTGSTPYEYRADALLCASRIIVEATLMAKEVGALASTGIIEARPGSVNTCPGTVRMTIDVRHARSDVVADLCQRIRARSAVLGRGTGDRHCTVRWDQTFESDAATFDPACIEAIRDVAVATVGSDRVLDMYSGAGHDSFSTSLRCPTGMIFVPSRDGISHNPSEFTEPEHW